MNTQALIVAAGRGTRLGQDIPKALAPIAGKPLLAHALHPFVDAELADDIVIVIPPGAQSDFEAAISAHFPIVAATYVDGGTERQDSVRAGLEALRPDVRWVIVHDAARPFVTPKVLRQVLSAAREHSAATAAVPCVDTILVSDPSQRISNVPDRDTLWSCQTPQAFDVDVLKAAHARAFELGLAATDDSRLVWEMGEAVHIVEGSPSNRKITTPDDAAWAEQILSKREEL